MRQAPRSRLAHTATGGKSGAERSSSQVPLFIDHRRPNGRSVPLFFVSRTNKFAVCKTSSPEESVCGPHATADGRKDPGTGLRWTTTDPVGSPPAKFEATAIDVQIHAVDEARLLGGEE